MIGRILVVTAAGCAVVVLLGIIGLVRMMREED